MIENKQEICNSLCATLQKTNLQRGLVALDFDDQMEVVTARYEDGREEKIGVMWDSGCALIMDVLREIVKF